VNVQDALGITTEGIRRIDETIGETEQTRDFLVQAEGIMIETLGTQNEETAKFAHAIQEVAAVQEGLNHTKLHLESLQGVLADIL